MPRVGGNLARRFRKVDSLTPLYRDDCQKFYWNHCWYCGCELVYDRHNRKKKANSFTRDHVYPASLGGGRGANTVPACNSCNKAKMTMTLEEFRAAYFSGKIRTANFTNLGGKNLFFAELREAELKAKLEKKEIRPTMRTQLAMILDQPKPEYIPIPDRSMVYREEFVSTPLTRWLRWLFKVY